MSCAAAGCHERGLHRVGPWVPTGPPWHRQLWQKLAQAGPHVALWVGGSHRCADRSCASLYYCQQMLPLLRNKGIGVRQSRPTRVHYLAPGSPPWLLCGLQRKQQCHGGGGSPETVVPFQTTAWHPLHGHARRRRLQGIQCLAGAGSLSWCSHRKRGVCQSRPQAARDSAHQSGQDSKVRGERTWTPYTDQGPSAAKLLSVQSCDQGHRTWPEYSHACSSDLRLDLSQTNPKPTLTRTITSPYQACIIIVNKSYVNCTPVCMYCTWRSRRKLTFSLVYQLSPITLVSDCSCFGVSSLHCHGPTLPDNDPHLT